MGQIVILSVSPLASVSQQQGQGISSLVALEWLVSCVFPQSKMAAVQVRRHRSLDD